MEASTDTQWRVLVTGADGYIGRVLCQHLAQTGYQIRAAVRSADSPVPVTQDTVAVGIIHATTDWQAALDAVDCVVHLAARAHVPDNDYDTALQSFRETNVMGTHQLVKQALTADVKRVVFVSSIGVHGELSIDSPFRETSPIRPVRPYQIAKWEAEQIFQTYQTQLDYVIVRPPLVYGPNAPGNLARLIHLLRRGLPLPLGGIHNARSLVGVRNLADFLLHCIHDTRAAQNSYVISDGEDISTPDLLRHLAQVLHLPLRLFPVPEWGIRLVARALGREQIVNQLWGSLQIDAHKARQQLGWKPPFSVADEMAWLGQHHVQHPNVR